MKPRLHSEDGFSLVLVLGAAALIATFILWFMTALQSSNRRQNDFARRREFTRTVANIRTQIQDPLLCTQLMSEIAVSSVVATTPPEVFDPTASPAAGYTSVATKIKAGDADQILKAGWFNGTTEVTSSLRIQDVQLRTLRTGIRTVRLDRRISAGVASGQPATFSTYEVALYLIPQVKNDDGVTWNVNFVNLGDINNPSLEDYRIKFYANVIAGNLYSCYTDTSPAQLCEMAGGGFDPYEHEPRYRCNPDQFCSADRSGIRPSTSAACLPPFTATQVGEVNGVSQVTCSWCWDGIKNTPDPLDL